MEQHPNMFRMRFGVSEVLQAHYSHLINECSHTYGKVGWTLMTDQVQICTGKNRRQRVLRSYQWVRDHPEIHIV